MTSKDEIGKQRVQSVHRDARPVAWDDGNGGVGGYEIWSNSDTKCLGEGRFEEAAWQNAAESLPAQPEPVLCKHCGAEIGFFNNFWRTDSGYATCKTLGTGKHEPVAPVEANEKESETTKIPCYEVYDAKDIDCTVFQHDRMKDLQEFVYQLLDGLEEGESIRIEFKNYTQEELDEVYDEL